MKRLHQEHQLCFATNAQMQNREINILNVESADGLFCADLCCLFPLTSWHRTVGFVIVLKQICVAVIHDNGTPKLSVNGKALFITNARSCVCAEGGRGLKSLSTSMDPGSGD